jgi:hypothetical protein
MKKFTSVNGINMIEGDFYNWEIFPALSNDKRSWESHETLRTTITSKFRGNVINPLNIWDDEYSINITAIYSDHFKKVAIVGGGGFGGPDVNRTPIIFNVTGFTQAEKIVDLIERSSDLEPPPLYKTEFRSKGEKRNEKLNKIL